MLNTGARDTGSMVRTVSQRVNLSALKANTQIKSQQVKGIEQMDRRKCA